MSLSKTYIIEIIYKGFFAINTNMFTLWSFKARPQWIRIQTGSVTELPNANSMQIQCASIASTLHCVEPNSRMHVDFKWPHLHTATTVPSSDLYFRQPWYCFSSWADTWNTVCSREKRSLSVVDMSVHATPFLVLTCNARLRDPVQSGSKPPLEVDWD